MTTAFATAFRTEPRFMSRANDHEILAAEEITRLARLCRNGDMNARDRIATTNLRLVVSMVRSYLRIHNVEYEVLYQQGVEGLMIAIDKFDPEMGYAFSTYATPCIRSKIEEFLLKNRVIHIPNKVMKMASKVNRMRRSLETNCGRRVEDAEIAEALNIDVKSVRDLTMAIQSDHSLDVQIGDEEDSVSYVSLVEDPSNTLDMVESLDLNNVLHKVMGECLSEREQLVVKTFYGFNEGGENNAAEIGRQLDLSRERVRQILSASLKTLSAKLSEMGLDITLTA
jgi:RNA polymerase sigma factor (sigma-70 family)